MSLVLSDDQAHQDFLRAALCWVAKGKTTPDIVIFGAFKFEVNLELSCVGWYGFVCRLSLVKMWLERVLWGSCEGVPGTAALLQVSCKALR